MVEGSAGDLARKEGDRQDHRKDTAPLALPHTLLVPAEKGLSEV